MQSRTAPHLVTPRGRPEGLRKRHRPLVAAPADPQNYVLFEGAGSAVGCPVEVLWTESPTTEIIGSPPPPPLRLGAGSGSGHECRIQTPDTCIQTSEF
jgi:hypothetical protein